MITHLVPGTGPFCYALAVLSEVGSRASNEDRLGMMDVAGRFLCCTLADGAGGQGNGALAARLTVDAVMHGARDNPMFAPAGLASLISMAEQHVSELQPTSASRRHMSATIVVLTIDQQTGQALWGHWGDSRLYWLREGRVQHMTEDHSLVQQLVQAGIYAGMDTSKLPNRSVLSGAIGAHSQVPPTVQSQAVDLAVGDALLLCSDGLWESLSVSDIETSLRTAQDAQAWLQALADKVTAQAKSNQDNYSAMAIWVRPSAHDELAA